MSLTDEQQLVVKKNEGHILVLAGPGSGKTHTLIEKLVYLFDKKLIPEPYGVLVVTFSNAAIREISSRLRTKGFRHMDRVAVKTFHSFAIYLLRCYGSDIGIREDFELIDIDEQSSVLKEILEKYNSNLNVYQFRNYIEGFKRQAIYPGYGDEKIGNSENALRFRQAFTDYQSYLTQFNKLDFTDVIVFAAKLLKESPLAGRLFRNFYRYIIVDEFQDTDRQQLELIKTLATSAMGSTIVADDDQSIYRFRGADRGNVEAIRSSLDAETLILQSNFRSPKAIVKAAQSVIEKDINRTEKYSAPMSNAQGHLCKFEFPSDKDEALQIAEWVRKLFTEDYVNSWGEIAIIARNRSRMKPVLDQFDQSGIPWFDRSNLAFEDSWEIDLALSILRLACDVDSGDYLYQVMNEIENAGLFYYLNNQDALDIACQFRNDLSSASVNNPDVSQAKLILELAGLYNLISKAIHNEKDKEKKINNLTALVDSLQVESTERNLNLLQIIELLAGNNAIQCMSSHGSKGREFNYVFFMGLEADIIPAFQAKTEDEIAEERRIFYVSLTRTRKAAYLTFSRHRDTFKNRQPSPFLLDIPEECFTPSIFQ